MHCRPSLLLAPVTAKPAPCGRHPGAPFPSPPAEVAQTTHTCCFVEPVNRQLQRHRRSIYRHIRGLTMTFKRMAFLLLLAGGRSHRVYIVGCPDAWTRSWTANSIAGMRPYPAISGPACRQLPPNGASPSVVNTDPNATLGLLLQPRVHGRRMIFRLWLLGLVPRASTPHGEPACIHARWRRASVACPTALPAPSAGPRMGCREDYACVSGGDAC